MAGGEENGNRCREIYYSPQVREKKIDESPSSPAPGSKRGRGPLTWGPLRQGDWAHEKAPGKNCDLYGAPSTGFQELGAHNGSGERFTRLGHGCNVL